MRMSHKDFTKLLNLIENVIEKAITPQQRSGGNNAISAKELTLRFLAAGETYRSMAFQFRISKAAISYIILEVCNAILNAVYIFKGSFNNRRMV